jgi:hypothetical protein
VLLAPRRRPPHDTAVLAALVTPGALLSRLDGEWW